MLQSTAIDYRESDLSGNSQARPGDVRGSAHGDFARGQRTNRVHAPVPGDFATGMRAGARPTVTGDFATGMRSSRTPRLTGDFATGMRTVAAPISLGRDSVREPSSLPIAA
jgi:hypothetical protein